MSRARRFIRRPHKVAEINITAFMNLMVVLAPFLLMTAVFTQITVLELNLPSLGDTSEAADLDALELRVTIRRDALTLSDSQGGVIKRIERQAQQPGFAQLHQALKQVKARIPDKTAIVILSEPDTPYDDLVQVMDACRSYRAVFEGRSIRAELFPDISLGDAPVPPGNAE